MNLSPEDLASLLALARQATAEPAFRADISQLISNHRYEFTEKLITGNELLTEYVAGLKDLDEEAFSNPATILERHRLFVSAFAELRAAMEALHAVEQLAAARKLGEAE